MPRFVPTIPLLLGLGLMLAIAPGCTPSQSRYKADLRAAHAGKRVPALVDAAGHNDPATLDDLVHALSDKDPAIRLFAIQSLKKRTGQTLDYRYYESSDKRRAAINRWHAWLAEKDVPSKPTTSGYDALPTDVD